MNYFGFKNKHNNWILLNFLILIFIISLITFPFFPLITSFVFLGFLILFALAIKPEIGLYLMILFLPVINLNFNFKNFEIPFIDLLTIVVLISYLLRIIFTSLFFTVNKSKRITLPFVLSFLMFFISISIGNLLSNDIFINIWYSLRWIMLFYLGYVFLPVNIIKEKNILRNSLFCFLASGLWVAIFGLISLTQQDWYNEFIRIRSISVFGTYPIGYNHNLIAEVLIVTIFFSLALKYWFKSIRANRVINLFALFFGLVLLGTFSRAAWLVLFIQIAIYFFYKNRKYIKKIVLPLIIALIIFSPFAIYMVKLQGQYEIGVSSTENRLLMAQISWQAFKERSFFGEGSGQFINLVADDIRFRAKYGEPLDSHGIWQKILAENGLFGILTFIVFIFYIFNKMRKSLKVYKSELNLLLPLVIGSLGIFLFEFFNTSYYKGKCGCQ